MSKARRATGPAGSPAPRGRATAMVWEWTAWLAGEGPGAGRGPALPEASRPHGAKAGAIGRVLRVPQMPCLPGDRARLFRRARGERAQRGPFR